MTMRTVCIIHEEEFWKVAKSIDEVDKTVGFLSRWGIQNPKFAKVRIILEEIGKITGTYYDPTDKNCGSTYLITCTMNKDGSYSHDSC